MNRKELVAKLEHTSRALANNNIIPIFQCFAFDGKTVTAFNGDIGIVATGANIAEKFCVNGATLLGLLSNTGSEEVDFTIDGNEVVAKSGRSTFRQAWFPIEDYLFDKPENKWDIGIPLNEDFVSGLQACLMTASKDNTQGAFMGVCLTDLKKKVHMYSTDGDAISRYSIEYAAKEPFRYMLPNGFCEAVIRLSNEFHPEKEGDPLGSLAVSSEWAQATLASGYTIYGRLLHVDNPIDYEAWIKKTIKDTPVYAFTPRGLDMALSRARVVADPESAKTNLVIKESRLKLVTQTATDAVRDTLAFGDYAEVEANVSAELVQRCVGLTTEMAIFENCCCFRRGTKLFILTSNMG